MYLNPQNPAKSLGRSSTPAQVEDSWVQRLMGSDNLLAASLTQTPSFQFGEQVSPKEIGRSLSVENMLSSLVSADVCMGVYSSMF